MRLLQRTSLCRASLLALLCVACKGGSLLEYGIPEPEPALNGERPGANASLVVPATSDLHPPFTAPTGAPSPPLAASHGAPSVARPAPPPPLETPRELRATAQPPSEVVLAWDASPGSTAYEVFEGGILIANVKEPRLVVTRLRAGVQRCWSVRAVADAGRPASARTPLACCTVPDTTAPGIPTPVVAEPKPHDGVVLSWGPAHDDVGVVAYEVSRDGVALTKVAATRFVDSGLVPLKQYCYTLRALDAAGNRSLSSAAACLSLADTRPPSLPANVVAKGRDERSIALSWSPSTDDVGVSFYEVVDVEKPITDAALTTQTTSAVLGGFRAATRHCYAVRACDAAGNCSTFSAHACATTPDLTPPSRPAAVAEAKGDDRIELRWKASTDNVGVASYEIRRGGDVLGRATPEHLALLDTGLRPTVEYCYAVEALDAAGNRSGRSASVCARPPDLRPPTAPGRPAALPVSSTQLFVAWDPSTDDVGVAGYEVARDGAVVARITATRMRDKGLSAARSYCYTVRAYDAAGNRSPATGPFCAATAKPTDLAAPSDLRVRRVSPTNVLLEWEPSEQEGVTYVVYAMGNARIGRTGGNSFTPSGTLGGKPSCYRVSAVDGEGRESAKSNEICASFGPEPVTQR